MKRMIAPLLAAAVAAAALAGPASADREDKTILDKVVELSGASGYDTDAGDFDVLREAVLATGLDSRLAAPRQSTVFAPTDQAFLDLTGETVEADAFEAVASLGVPAVTRVLKYHITPGRQGASRVVQARRLPTLLPHPDLRKPRGAATLTDEANRTVQIVAPNAAVLSNGIVHVIDGVLLPFAP